MKRASPSGRPVFGASLDAAMTRASASRGNEAGAWAREEDLPDLHAFHEFPYSASLHLPKTERSHNRIALQVGNMVGACACRVRIAQDHRYSLDLHCCIDNEVGHVEE